MIKAVIFDLDGVLIDADKIHFEALNYALQQLGHPPIGWMEHTLMYKGRPTTTKLDLLQQRRHLSFGPGVADLINFTKQERTLAEIAKLTPNPQLTDLFRILKKNGIKTAVASNAKLKTVVEALFALGLDPELTVGNDALAAPKPDPEIYLQVLGELGLEPEEALILEDSEVGLEAAYRSGAHVLEIGDVDEVNIHKVASAVVDAITVNVVIPAAGAGRRFAEAGYAYPKPFIVVDDQPMLGHVLSNLVIPNDRQIVLLQRDDIRRYTYGPQDTSVVPVDGLTEGAAATVLLAERLINTPQELVIANSDQLVLPGIQEFVAAMRLRGADAGMIVFTDDDPKWSYAELNERGTWVAKVAEKEVLPGNNATAGVYWFRRGDFFVKAARRMMGDDANRVNGEWYVAPVFNLMIEAGQRVAVWSVSRTEMVGLGTPEDLESWISAQS